MALLKENGIELPTQPETSAACSAAAKQLVELDSSIPAAAVISSYAEPLLEGCGTIKKGELRVIGETKELPFVTAFVNQKLDKDLREKIGAALLDSVSEPDLLVALESLDGFVELPTEEESNETTNAEKQKATSPKK